MTMADEPLNKEEKLEKWEEAKEAVVTLLKYIGENPSRDGLRGTPLRFVDAWRDLLKGYKMDPSKILTTFEDVKCDQMVLLKEVEFSSLCEHHLLPFMGKAHIAYVPNDNRIVGISKLARLLEIYSRRLQIQERICQQVVDALMEHLKPKGAACILEAQHLCLKCRGIKKQNAVMVCSALGGVFLEDPSTRSEFFNLIR